MNTNIYYLSIKSTSLAHYIGKGLIFSSRVYEKRPSDIQTIESDYIILSKDKFLNDSNCSIELVLNDKEIDNYIKKIEESLFVYLKPIPISRVKKIYFNNKIQSLKTIDTIRRGVGFIPEKLVEVINEEKKSISFKIDGKYRYDKELKEKIKTYNQVLGGISFSRYTIEGKYSKNYFSILSHFNRYIINNYIEKKSIFTGYDGAFTYIGKIWDKLSPLIYKNISEDDVERYAKEENISIEKSNGVFKYELLDKNSIKSLTYKLAILSIYGNDSTKRKKIEDLIYDCKHEKIPKESIEGIFLIFGINSGYSAFYNEYDKKIVKFKMDSLLDYYTIESVFQYVINDKKYNDRFEYIDELFFDEQITLDIPNVESKKKIKENSYTLEKLTKIIQEFKLVFNKRMQEKDNEIKCLQYELEKLKDINSKFDEEKEKINIEKDLEMLLLKDLKKIARENKIKGRSKMNKATLLKAIKEN